jgi:hypothetical protein
MVRDSSGTDTAVVRPAPAPARSAGDEVRETAVRQGPEGGAAVTGVPWRHADHVCERIPW